jgi:membrane associated rhomboid family serine protease
MIPIHDTEPSRRPPVAVVGLIGLNLASFLLQLGLPEDLLHAWVGTFGLIPARLESAWDGAWQGPLALLPLVSSQFLHGSVLHLLGNMWMLWLFGDNVEDRMGSKRFVAFYLLTGLVAGLVHVVSNPGSPVPTIGASGAVAGVMGAYLLLFPRARVIVMVPILFYPLFFQWSALSFLGLWFAIQYFSGFTESLLGGDKVGGVAYWAHVGGFLAGMLFFWPFLKPRAERRRLFSDEWGPEQAWRPVERPRRW